LKTSQRPFSAQYSKNKAPAQAAEQGRSQNPVLCVLVLLWSHIFKPSPTPSWIGVQLFNNFLGLFGVTNLVAIQLGGLPWWIQLVIIFVVRDFMQYNIHRLLHRTGQLGHANLYLPLGKLLYLLNSPQMHLWHHAKTFPESHPRGFNFGITLSVWDFIFKTNYWPDNDPDLAV